MCFARGEGVTKWVRLGLALVVAGIYETGGAGNTKETLPPIESYLSPEIVDTKPISWLYNQFGSELSRGAIIFNKTPYYTEYRNGNQQIIKVEKSYYETGGQFNCRAYPLSKADILFYESCGDLFGSFYKIIDFKNKRIFSDYGDFILKYGDIFYLSTGYWRGDSPETYPFQYPWLIILDTARNTVTTYKFGKPEQHYIDEAARCSDGRGGRLLRSYLRPTGDIIRGRTIIMALPYLSRNEGLKYTPNCRLRFIFDTKTKRGRYFLF